MSAPCSRLARLGLCALLCGAAALAAAADPGPATAPGGDSGKTTATVPAAATTRVVAGELVHLADAARLTDCASGRSFPVAMEGDWPRAERAYRGAATPPGAPVYISFEGGLEERPGMQADASEATMVIRRFIHAWPGERCERARADAHFANTYWRIVALGGAELVPAAGRREPQLRVRAPRDAAARGEFSASVGCNAINGRFERDGQALRLAPGATTRMACPPPLDALERRLLDALARSVALRIHANTLELFDARGASLALLQAVYL